MNNEAIIQRKTGREKAESLLAELAGLNMPHETCRAFWRAILLGMPPEYNSCVSTVMSDKQAKAFEKLRPSMTLPPNSCYADIDINTLTEFLDRTKELKAYINSDRGQHRLRVEG